MSHKAVPAALRQAARHVFAGLRDGLWLVGGTALAGYYAEHRRSDDLDLFAKDETSFQTAVRNVRGLAAKGATFSGDSLSPYYFHTVVRFTGHDFTVDIVLDPNLHKVGCGLATADRVIVADLPTLAAMKTAALVSRCSEKDLFDMDWIINRAESWNVRDAIESARCIDAGVTAETLLLSLQGAVLREEACDFALRRARHTPRAAYRKIVAIRKRLINDLLAYEKAEPLPEAAAAIAGNLKDFRRRRSSPR